MPTVHSGQEITLSVPTRGCHHDIRRFRSSDPWDALDHLHTQWHVPCCKGRLHLGLNTYWIVTMPTLALTSTMGLFYVWLKYSVSNSLLWSESTNLSLIGKQNSSDYVYQWFIIFANREAADEWWGMISTSSSIHAGHIKHISPQLYVQINGEYVWSSLNDSKSPATRRFFERILLTGSTNDSKDIRTVIAPSTDITDHISSQWWVSRLWSVMYWMEQFVVRYFICSKVDPMSHWYLHTSGTCCQN